MEIRIQGSVKGAKSCLSPASQVCGYLLERFLVEDTKGRLNFNDALVIIGANEKGIKKIVSFDADFDGYMERIG